MPTSPSRGVPPLSITTPAIARAHKSHDEAVIVSAARDHAAAKIDAAITRALAASGQPLRRDHAEALSARLKAASA